MAMVENGSSQETNRLIPRRHSVHRPAHVSEEGEEGLDREMRELEAMFSKLNPMAKEFVPPSVANNNGPHMELDSGSSSYPDQMGPPVNPMYPDGFADTNGNTARKGKKGGYYNGNNQNKRMNNRAGMAQNERSIRRTVYVTDVDHQVTEEQLAALFLGCGQVVDCRVCGDPNSVLRFAFVEFTNEEAARAALTLSGTTIGYYPVKVMPSKTAIAPVNPTLLPQTEDEREQCARTVYVANIDKKVSKAAVKLFFESICGDVVRLRLRGDNHHSTHIAFVEFAMAENAVAALNCSGVVLGLLPIRVSPSKTPVRTRVPRPLT